MVTKMKASKCNVTRRKCKSSTKVVIPGREEGNIIHSSRYAKKTPSFAHVAKSYKATKTLNSRNARKACNVINHGASNSCATSRNKFKLDNLAGLKVYHPVEEKAAEVKRQQDKSGLAHRTFFSGDDSRELPNNNLDKSSLVLSATLDLQVIDDINGFHLTDGQGQVVCRMLPRAYALQDQQNLHSLLKALEDMNCSSAKSLVRGGKRIVGLIGPKEEDCKYVCVGLSPCRNKQGLYEKWPKSIHPSTRRNLQKFYNFVNDKMKTFVEKHLLVAFGKITFGRCKEIKEIKGGVKDGTNVLVAGAIGMGSYLNSHTDHDAFLSIYTGHCASAVDSKSNNYKLNCAPIGYFCFPDQGCSVALRPGDILIFNAQKYNHCSSTPTPEFCSDKAVFNISLYLKTAIMAGNSNI